MMTNSTLFKFTFEYNSQRLVERLEDRVSSYVSENKLDNVIRVTQRQCYIAIEFKIGCAFQHIKAVRELINDSLLANEVSIKELCDILADYQLLGFNEAQLGVIYLGYKDNLDYSQYANKNISAEIMLQHYHALKWGKDISKYVDKPYTKQQLTQIYMGLGNIDVSEYDSVDTDDLIMASKRHALSAGLPANIVNWEDYDIYQMHALWNALLNKIDISLYASPDRSAGELSVFAELLHLCHDLGLKDLTVYSYLDIVKDLFNHGYSVSVYKEKFKLHIVKKKRKKIGFLTFDYAKRVI